MKNTFKIVAGILLLIPNFSFAAFSVDQIKSVECRDPRSSSRMNVYFSTTDEHAGKYGRNDGSIPYSYGNKTSEYYVSQSGVMSLGNDPDSSKGTIVLYDNSNPQGLSLLILKKISNSDEEYAGLLTGHVEIVEGQAGISAGHAEIDESWQFISNYRLYCKVKWN